MTFFFAAARKKMTNSAQIVQGKYTILRNVYVSLSNLAQNENVFKKKV